jgi:hypothetical protein
VTQQPQFIIEFDHRDDGGPRRVGPFPARSAAVGHVERLNQLEAVWTVVPLTPPEADTQD